MCVVCMCVVCMCGVCMCMCVVCMCVGVHVCCEHTCISISTLVMFLPQTFEVGYFKHVSTSFTGSCV